MVVLDRQGYSSGRRYYCMTRGSRDGGRYLGAAARSGGVGSVRAHRLPWRQTPGNDYPVVQRNLGDIVHSIGNFLTG
jgi:hypothetical protein